MRQLVRILVKIIPHSIAYLAVSDEGGGGNRISEDQIKNFLDKTLGEAPRPAWGVPNGWGYYLSGACREGTREGAGALKTGGTAFPAAERPCRCLRQQPVQLSVLPAAALGCPRPTDAHPQTQTSSLAPAPACWRPPACLHAQCCSRGARAASSPRNRPCAAPSASRDAAGRPSSRR